MGVGKKGLRLDELLQYNNDFLSVESYFYCFYDHLEVNDLTSAIAMVSNPDVKDFKVFIFRNKIKKKDKISKDIENYYGIQIDELLHLLNSNDFCFLVMARYNYIYLDKIFIPNETFKNYDEACCRAKAIVSTNNLLKIKKYLEHH